MRCLGNRFFAFPNQLHVPMNATQTPIKPGPVWQQVPLAHQPSSTSPSLYLFRSDMNQGFLLLLALTAMLAVVLAKPAEDKYTDKYDNVNLDEILANERLYKKYLECLLAENDSHCTADGKELRKAIPDALTTECSKCNEKQKNGTQKVIKHLRDKKDEDWKKLLTKYDPENIYLSKFGDKIDTPID